MQNKEIIFVASGKIKIPPKGYGAVENIIWNYKINLEKEGFKVNSINTKNIFKLVINTVLVNNKILYFHYEPYLIISYLLNKFFFRKNKILFTSHNGYITTNSETYFYKIIAKIISFFSDAIMISLSKSMQEYFLNKGFKGKTYLIPNAIEINKFKKIDNPKKNIIYLGNINKNKGQELFLKYFNLNLKIDFVGPYLDKNINLGKNNYLGVWSKKEVYNNSGNYKVLVLLSNSEADPLVVKEALASGCSLLISKKAGENLEKKEFIKIIDINKKDDLEKINFYLEKLLNENKKYRKDIFEYAKKFDWENVIKEFKKLLSEI